MKSLLSRSLLWGSILAFAIFFLNKGQAVSDDNWQTGWVSNDIYQITEKNCKEERFASRLCSPTVANKLKNKAERYFMGKKRYLSPELKGAINGYSCFRVTMRNVGCIYVFQVKKPGLKNEVEKNRK